MNKGQLNVYRGCKPVVDAKYGPQGDGSVAEVLLEALAEAAEVDPTDLPPLYEHVDLDALDNLFEEQAATSNGYATQLPCRDVERVRAWGRPHSGL